MSTKNIPKPGAEPKEFTLRNKSSATPIQTLSQRVFQAFLEARPESAALVLAKFKADYKRLTGKSIVLTDEQTQALLKHFGANEKRVWSSEYSGLGAQLTAVKNCFQDGFMNRTTSAGLLPDLTIAETFFEMLDTAITV